MWLTCVNKIVVDLQILFWMLAARALEFDIHISKSWVDQRFIFYLFFVLPTTQLLLPYDHCCLLCVLYFELCKLFVITWTENRRFFCFPWSRNQNRNWCQKWPLASWLINDNMRLWKQAVFGSANWICFLTRFQVFWICDNRNGRRWNYQTSRSGCEISNYANHTVQSVLHVVCASRQPNAEVFRKWYGYFLCTTCLLQSDTHWKCSLFIDPDVLFLFT